MKFPNIGLLAAQSSRKPTFASTVAFALLLFATISNTPARDDSMPGQVINLPLVLV